MNDPIMKQAAMVAAITNNQVTNWTVDHRKVLISIKEGTLTPEDTTESILEDVMKLITMLPDDPLSEPVDPFDIPNHERR